MKAQTEGLLWQVIGLLVAMVAVEKIRSAAKGFSNIFNSRGSGPGTGTLDVVWFWAVGTFAGFLLLAGVSAMITGHLLRVMRGSSHRNLIWEFAGWVCCFAGVIAMVVKMTDVAMWRRSPVEHVYFFQMLTQGDFAIAISGAYFFLVGIMLLMADRLGMRLRRVFNANSTPVGKPLEMVRAQGWR